MKRSTTSAEDHIHLRGPDDGDYLSTSRKSSDGVLDPQLRLL